MKKKKKNPEILSLTGLNLQLLLMSNIGKRTREIIQRLRLNLKAQSNQGYGHDSLCYDISTD